MSRELEKEIGSLREASRLILVDLVELSDDMSFYYKNKDFAKFDDCIKKQAELLNKLEVVELDCTSKFKELIENES